MNVNLPKLPPNFVDPITGYPPTNEVQISGLLGLFHQMGRVRWENVPLFLPTNQPSGIMADELFAGTLMCGEYQLFWSTYNEMQVWGSMPADLICFSKNKQIVTMVENKIGAGFTGVQGDVAVGQLGRQLEFLQSCKFSKRALVLLSTTELFNKGWYRNELAGALKHGDREKRVTGFLMCWEGILSALD